MTCKKYKNHDWVTGSPLEAFSLETSSVKWIELGHIFKNPKMQILAPVFFFLFFTKNVKMKINQPKTFI